jgi:hypothetical protein
MRPVSAGRAATFGGGTGHAAFEHGGERVIAGKLRPVRRDHEKEFADQPPKPAPEPVRRPARVTVMLALAHKIEDAIQRGVAHDRADVARPAIAGPGHGALELTLLVPEIQEDVLRLESVNGVEPVCERRVRFLVRAGDWARQREARRTW